jgi:hypothetical protein
LFGALEFGDEERILDGTDDRIDPNELHELSEAKPVLEPIDRGEDVCAVCRDSGEGGVVLGDTDSGAGGCPDGVLEVVFEDALKGLLIPPALAGRRLLSPNKRDMVETEGAQRASDEVVGGVRLVGAKVTVGVVVMFEGPA